MRSNDEVREYLMRWLLEFGDGPVTADQRKLNTWYMGKALNYNASTLVMYFDTAPDKRRIYSREVQLNRAGLDLLKGDAIEKT